jgi:hypothetical protein
LLRLAPAGHRKTLKPSMFWNPFSIPYGVCSALNSISFSISAVSNRGSRLPFSPPGYYLTRAPSITLHWRYGLLAILLIHEYAAYVYGIADAGFRTISGSCPNPLDMVIGLHLLDNTIATANRLTDSNPMEALIDYVVYCHLLTDNFHSTGSPY